MRRKLHIILVITLSFAALILSQAECLGVTYYCDPDKGDISNDGSYEHPWSTLQEVFESGKIQRRTTPTGSITNPTAPVAPGDTIKLRTGYHGAIGGYKGWHNNEGPITIEADDGHYPSLGYFNVHSFSNWVFRGLEVQAELTGSYAQGGISIKHHGTFGDSSKITIENCNISTASDATVSSWNESDWASNARGGIGLYSRDDGVVRNNSIQNVGTGIIAGGNNLLVEYNTINKFAFDGLRPQLGDDQTWQYNTVKNSLEVNSNHDDGMQVYVGAATISGMTIRGNKFFGYADPTVPYSSEFQGIFCGGGDWQNWTIENNLIVVDHWHGISIDSPINTKIINNTVVLPPNGTRSPWILLYNPGEARDVVVRNNIVWHGLPSDDPTNNVSVDHNLEISSLDPTEIFTDYENYDFTLKPGGPAIDAGSDVLAPDTDIEGNPRPYGIGYDIGAYEYTLLPRVVISAKPKQGYPPLKVLFGISELITPNGEIVEWEWDLGDGATSQEKETSHTYTSPGEYTVTLTVTDIQGYKGQSRTHITVLRKEKEFEELSTGCYNNVFNPIKGERALIVVKLQKQAHVKISLYDTRGNKIRELADEERDAETCKYYWDGKDDSGNIVGSGLYFVHIQAGDYKKTKKIVVVK